MSSPRRQSTGAGDRRLAVFVVVLFAGAAALDALADAHGAGVRTPYVGATIFSVIVAGIQALAGWLATAAEVTVTYLATVVSWLASHVAHFLVSSGAMFARIWDAVKVVWNDVVKPALVWLDKSIRALHDWLVKTFKPVFEFLNDLRERIQKFYDKFVRPVTDTIDFIRQLNGVLLTLHITVLQDVDAMLAQLRRYIDEPFAWLNAQLNRVQNVVDLIVDGNGFFQKWTLVASLRKHAPLWLSHFWADQVGPVRGKDGSTERTADYPEHAGAVDAGELAQYFTTGDGPRAAIVGELSRTLMQTAEAPPASTTERAA